MPSISYLASLDMRLYIHHRHIYEDRASRTIYRLEPGMFQELPDNVGELLLTNHGNKFCRVDDGATFHNCGKDDEVISPGYSTTAYGAPEDHRMLFARLSPQKRKMLQKQMHRSRRARMEFYGQELGKPAEDNKADKPRRGRPPKSRE